MNNNENIHLRVHSRDKWRVHLIYEVMNLTENRIQLRAKGLAMTKKIFSENYADHSRSLLVGGVKSSPFVLLLKLTINATNGPHGGGGGV